MSLPALLRRPRGLSIAVPGLLGPELALVALADALFWDRAVGLSLAVFCAAVALSAAWLRRGRARGRFRTALAVPVLLAALAPSVERPTALSIAFALAGTLLALRFAAARGSLWPSGLRTAAGVALAGPGQVVRDTMRRRSAIGRRRRSPGGAAGGRARPWLAWIAPLGLTGAFAVLLAQANPLIAAWIAALPVPSPADAVEILPRLLFWLAVLAVLWPLIRPRRPAPSAPAPVRPAPAVDVSALDRLAAVLLTPEAVLRALVLLDLLLALQIGLDGAYLWGGLALPGGVTYAAYAHRGAYPLVATALLAGAVALAVRRPGAPAPSRAAAALLLLFLGENVVLVVSAMERLSFYVAAYALTEWRVAAFAWMGLVAFGLGLIAAAGLLGRDGRWLLRANALAALAVLYGWCFLDVPRLVADYDVAHCAELKGEGPELDIHALGALGPEALPALDHFLLSHRPRVDRLQVWSYRGNLESEVRAGMSDWRGWSLAGWRLARYLDTVDAAAAADQLRDLDRQLESDG